MTLYDILSKGGPKHIHNVTHHLGNLYLSFQDVFTVYSENLVMLNFFLIGVYPVANGSSATSQNGLLSILDKCGTGNSDNKAAQNTCCNGKINQKYVQMHYPY